MRHSIGKLRHTCNYRDDSRACSGDNHHNNDLPANHNDDRPATSADDGSAAATHDCGARRLQSY